MAKGINKVILIGNLGQDPEVRPLPSGGMVANVNIATTDAWKDKETGQQRENTEWHRVVFFNKTAEIVQQYLKKGSKIYVEGRLQTRKWQDQNGQDRFTTEIVGNDMQMLDTRPSGQTQGAPQGDQPPQGNGYPPQGNPPPQGNGYPQQGNPPPQGNGYPPQGNPPPQGNGYPPQGNPPPQGNGYPQQGNPPPQGNGYPPQGNPPPQGNGYPPQGNPPRNGQPPMPGGNNQHPPF